MNNESDKERNEFHDGLDAAEVSLVHLSGTQHEDCTLQEATTTPKQTQVTYRRDKNDSAVRNKQDLKASGGLRRGGGQEDDSLRRHLPTHSPSKYYIQEVSFTQSFQCTR